MKKGPLSFHVQNMLPGVYHICDVLGVHMTLLVGTQQALLIDTGYGLEDVSEICRELTDLPVSVVLTHGHHDHALGSRWFQQVFIHPEDLPVFSVYTGEPWRRSVLESVRAKGLSVDEAAFLHAPMAQTVPWTDDLADPLDLGNLHVHIFHAPGHTPGSLMAYVPEHRLLLPGDNWNPVTWCFFPEALRVQDLISSLRAARSLPFERILCPHCEVMLLRSDLDSFLDSFLDPFSEDLTEDRLLTAEKTDLGARFHVDARKIVIRRGHELCFDYAKAFPPASQGL